MSPGGTESALPCMAGKPGSAGVEAVCQRRSREGAGVAFRQGAACAKVLGWERSGVFWERRRLRAGLRSGGLGEDQGRSWPCWGPRFSHEQDGGPSNFGCIFLEDFLASRGPQSRAKGGVEAKRPRHATGCS